MKFRGHPVLGGISGFFLGIFVALILQQFGIRDLDNLSVIGLPLVGLALGLGMAAWAPFNRGQALATAGAGGSTTTPMTTREPEDRPEP